VAPDGSGGPPVTAGRSQARLNVTLGAVVLLMACACVVGGLYVSRTHEQRAAAVVEQERYGDVLAAATDEAEAFVNLRYDDAEGTVAKVAAGATGGFRKQYDSSAKGVIRVLKRNRSVMDGTVVWAGVVDAGPDAATVIAATSGTVANARSDDKPVARNYRLKLDLVRSGGQWLTSDLEFVD
jgi:Mce-associated membrane protein